MGISIVSLKMTRGHIMQASVGDAEDPRHSPTGKGEPPVVSMMASDWIALGF